jgi:putative colanic acid biosynthesis glycosyltransferase WcaI
MKTANEGKTSSVLFLSPFFYPEAISTGKYNTSVVQALVQRGYEVNVVASHPLYPTWKPHWSSHILEGASVHRGGAWVRYAKSVVLRRLTLELWFAWHSIQKAWMLRNEVSLVVAVFPPSLFFVLVHLLLPKNVVRVGIVHDLQGLLGLSQPGALIRFLYGLVHTVENYAFSSCDKLILLSRSMARTAIQEFGLDPRKVAVCYPFVSLKDEVLGEPKLAHMFPEGYSHVVYSGALGKKQNSVGLLEFFRAAAQEIPDAQFHFVSDGPGFEELRKLHAARPVDRIHFHNLVAEADLQELYTRSAVQVIPLFDLGSNACLPSKLPNVLATGCAVLAICQKGSELDQLVTETGSGIAVQSWEPEALVDALRSVLRQSDRQDRRERQELAGKLLNTEFSLDLLIQTICGPAFGKESEINSVACITGQD